MIPLNKPYLRGAQAAILEALGGQISGGGPFDELCCRELEAIVGCRKAFLTTSCTDALEMAATLLNISPGDEVIVPSYTFPSTVNPFIIRGAKPVFSDSTKVNPNMDPFVKDLITDRTKAIVVVHYAGVPCDMGEVLDLAGRRGIAVVEDNAHGLFAVHGGRRLGSLGAMAALSFHESKNFTCGEGGALLINDPRYVRRAEIIREKGTDRARYFRNEVSKYSWVDVGSSHLPSEILAAILLSQLRQCEHIQNRRLEIWCRYRAEIPPTLAMGSPSAVHSSHIFYVMVEKRDQFVEFMRGLGITVAPHYVPLHLSPMGKRYWSQPLPHAEKYGKQLVRLPIYPDLTDEEQGQIIQGVKLWSKSNL